MIKYRNGFKYQLCESYTVNLGLTIPKEILTNWFNMSTDGVLKVNSGYAWDGPSGPTFDTRNFMRGSLIHDVLYQAMRLEALPMRFRGDADVLLKMICIEDGMSKLRAWWVYQGVRFGAKWSVLPSRERQLMMAP